MNPVNNSFKFVLFPKTRKKYSEGKLDRGIARENQNRKNHKFLGQKIKEGDFILFLKKFGMQCPSNSDSCLWVNIFFFCILRFFINFVNIIPQVNGCCMLHYIIFIMLFYYFWISVAFKIKTLHFKAGTNSKFWKISEEVLKD